LNEYQISIALMFWVESGVSVLCG